MDRAAFDSLDWEGLIGVALAQAEAIERLGALVAKLQAELGRPPKTPDNFEYSAEPGPEDDGVREEPRQKAPADRALVTDRTGI
jgi:hypothetical protein